MKRSVVISLLSLSCIAVGGVASFSAYTYAAFSAGSNVDQTIGVKRSIYLDVATTSWNDGTAKYGVWVWKDGNSGFFADSEAFMQHVTNTTRYRITLPSEINRVIFVKHTDGAAASWATLKKTDNPKKIAFQTVDIVLTSEWDTFTITDLADAYTDDNYQKWTGNTSLNYSS